MDPYTAECISQTLFEINKSMKNIDKTLARIADALEKQTAPSVDGREVAGTSDECGFPDELKEEMGRFQAAFEKAYGNGR